MVASRLVLLVEGGAYGMVTRIKIEVVLELGIWEVHGDLAAHGLFESVERGQLGVTPSPGVGGLEKLGEGRGDVRVVLDEALVEAADAEEGAVVLGAFWDGTISDGLGFLRLFLNPKRGDNEIAEIDARHCAEALRPLGEEFFSAEFGKHQAEVLLVVGLGAGVDDDVVDVDCAELVILLEKEIHSPLESGGRVAEAKGHDAELEGAIAGLEGGAFAVLGDDLDLVEPRPEVHFGEHP